MFFLFPIFWIFLMSFQTNEQVLRIPPSLFFTPTTINYASLITGKLQTAAGSLDLAFMQNLWNSVLLSTLSVALALLLGVPAAYAFARFKFPLSEDIAFTLLSFRFAPPLLVLLPLSLYFQDIGLDDTYVGLIWVYQLIALPLILWIVRGYFEDISPDIEHAYRIAGHSWLRTFMAIAIPLARPGHRRGGAARLHLLLEQFRVRADPRLRREAAGDRRRARLCHGFGHTIRTDRRGDRAFGHADAGARALCAALSGRRTVARRGERLNMPQIELRSLSQSFKTGKVLDGLTLAADEGEIVCVFGPSGVGKTVLLRLIAGVETLGRGLDLSRRPRRDRRAAGDARRRHRVPEFRAVSAYVGLRQYRQRADRARRVPPRRSRRRSRRSPRC